MRSGGGGEREPGLRHTFSSNYVRMCTIDDTVLRILVDLVFMELWLIYYSLTSNHLCPSMPILISMATST